MSLYEWIEVQKKKRFYRLLFGTTKVGLGFTFIISGIRKFPGLRFTIIPPDNPIGLFFEGMYQTGFYWNFIGYYQIVCALLLLTKRFSALATLMILPITVNIFVITISLHMRGTPFISGAMLLGNIYLVLWHIKDFYPLLDSPHSDTE